MLNGTNCPKKYQKSKNFHFRYAELCRSKNFSPVQEIKKKGCTADLDFYGDKLKIEDWLLISESLYYDQALQAIKIKLRKLNGQLVEHVDNEIKARVFRKRPLIYTKFIFSKIIDSLCQCVKVSKNLQSIVLEALPFEEKFVSDIAQALSFNRSIKEVSFSRSSLGDKGCEIICNAIKCLENIEKINFSQCQLTAEGAGYITDLIKFQKIYRFSEGWKKSLRYREVDPNTIPGLRAIILDHNTEIGDQGMNMICEVLKEDVWIKTISMEDCGLTDNAAKYVAECLDINNYLEDFNISRNTQISRYALRNIRNQLGLSADNEDNKNVNGKVSLAALMEKINHLEKQIATERRLRKQAEDLTVQLHEQIMSYKVEGHKNREAEAPKGFVLVNQKSLDNLVKERNELRKALTIKKVTKSRRVIRPARVKKSKSETTPTYRPDSRQIDKHSKSSHGIFEVKSSPKKSPKIIVESNIGDNLETEAQLNSHRIPLMDAKNNFMGMEALKVFMTKKSADSGDSGKISTQAQDIARSLFIGNRELH